jgi:divalent metal cation (Fe/Co/Zn/Cd) transporter
LEQALGVEPTVHMDPVHPNDPVVNEIKNYLNDKWRNNDRIIDFHDIRVVKTENHHVILFGINMIIGLGQDKIVECCKSLEEDLAQKYPGYEIKTNVSPLYRY